MTYDLHFRKDADADILSPQLLVDIILHMLRLYIYVPYTYTPIRLKSKVYISEWIVVSLQI